MIDAVVPSIFVNFFWDWWKHQRSPLVIAEELGLIADFFSWNLLPVPGCTSTALHALLEKAD